MTDTETIGQSMTAELPVRTLRTLLDLAVAGYNAEIRYKSFRRFRGERPAEYAMRKADEKSAIDSVRPLVALPGVVNPPREIE